jgi:hypothetical protein
VELHVQALQTLVLLEPHRTRVVAYIDLPDLADQLTDLLVVEDVAQTALHAIAIFKLI